MISGEINLRVRYQETDCMGVVNHINYINYFEVARTELLRTTGISYRQIEQMGVMLPVIEVAAKYHKPAHYDDELTIKVSLKKKPSIKVQFEYEIFRGDELLITGTVVLAFMDATTRRPCRAPQVFTDIMTPYFD
ncbi:MAG: thioesterase family protein [Rikenellaceae bacterium]